MKDPDLSLEFFKDTLENGDERAVRRALGHMIAWHEIYRVEMHTEFAIAVGGSEQLVPTTELYSRGVENQPGVTILQRKATNWEPKNKNPLGELFHGSPVFISDITLPDS